jgi:hydroxymethylbilane synthase
MVGSALQKIYPHLQISYHFQESAGDKDLTSPLWKMPGKGVFTRDLQLELIENKIDCIVHSWKDLDLEDRMETNVLSVLPREDQRDLLLFKKSVFETPSANLVFCTSSPRREYNLRDFFTHHLPKRLQNIPLSFHPIRGNIQTRIKTFMEGNYSGLILAKAALDRIFQAQNEDYLPNDERPELQSVCTFIRSSLQECLFSVLPLSYDPNAPAQGSLAVEILKTNSELHTLFSSLTHPEASSTTTKERKILSYFGGGCHQKIGVAVQKYPFGEVCFLRGLTDSGVKLNQSDVVHEIDDEYIQTIQSPSTNKNSLRYSKEEIWPINGVMASRGRTRLHADISAQQDLFIARGFALPESYSVSHNSQIVWTAGTTTWKELANRDIWVHGTFDGLGEHPLDDELKYIAGKKLQFHKLTHRDSKEIHDYPTIFTYIAGEPAIPPNFNPECIKAVFWRSSTEFDFVTQLYPQLKNVDTYCGPGSTYQHLLNDPVIQNSKKPKIYLSFKDWIRKCTI